MLNFYYIIMNKKYEKLFCQKSEFFLEKFDHSKIKGKKFKRETDENSKNTPCPMNLLQGLANFFNNISST